MDIIGQLFLKIALNILKNVMDVKKFSNVQRAPASTMNPIIKPWPFRGWAIDLIG